MAGTINGGKKAADRNKQLYGDDFYRRIGSKGGKNGKGAKKGFAAMPREKRVAAGRKGGLAKATYSLEYEDLASVPEEGTDV